MTYEYTCSFWILLENNLQFNYFHFLKNTMISIECILKIDQFAKGILMFFSKKKNRKFGKLQKEIPLTSI